MNLPNFKYHPDPIATGAIKTSDAVCDCCELPRGFAYTSNLYSPEEIESLCPWCIADGSAAKKFDGMFCDDYPLHEAGISEDVIDEVSHRTPGFNSWQQEVWMCCCNDACEFHGDLSKEEIKRMTLEEIQRAFEDTRLTDDFFYKFKKNYEAGGNPAVYKWVCRHCGKIQHYADFA